MKQINPHAYSIQISAEIVDGQSLFHARVKELPDVLGLGESYSEAYEEAIDAISHLYLASTEEGREFPAPIPHNDEYTGRITLRLERSLHRLAAELAQAEGVSLNSLIAGALTHRVSFAFASQTHKETNRREDTDYRHYIPASIRDQYVIASHENIPSFKKINLNTVVLKELKLTSTPPSQQIDKIADTVFIDSAFGNLDDQLHWSSYGRNFSN